MAPLAAYPEVHACELAHAQACLPAGQQYICRCLRVTAEQIETAAREEGATTVRDVIRTTTAGAGCTACHRRIRELLRAAAEQRCHDAAEEVGAAAGAA